MAPPKRPTRLVVSGGPKAQPYLSQLPVVDDQPVRFKDMAHPMPSRARATASMAAQVILSAFIIFLLIVLFITTGDAPR